LDFGLLHLLLKERLNGNRFLTHEFGFFNVEFFVGLVVMDIYMRLWYGMSMGMKTP
jgi:hypothetical protein